MSKSDLAREEATGPTSGDHSFGEGVVLSLVTWAERGREDGDGEQLTEWRRALIAAADLIAGAMAAGVAWVVIRESIEAESVAADAAEDEAHSDEAIRGCAAGWAAARCLLDVREKGEVSFPARPAGEAEGIPAGAVLQGQG